jgi:hypothetical protein
MVDNQFRKLPYQGGDARLVAEIVNRTIDGGLNSTGKFTAVAHSSTTTVNDERVGENSVILFMPHSSGAAQHINHFYMQTVNNGSFDVAHQNSGDSQVYSYVIIG